MVQIYLMHTELLQEQALYRKLLESCSEERRKRAEQLFWEEDRCRSVAASALLDCALRSRGVREKTVRYAFGPAGKPVISGLPGFHFSLSHSGDMAMCAVSDREIGADLQKNRPVSDRVKRRFFSQREQESSDLLRLWTMKESYGKLTGEGISVMGDTEILTDRPVELLRNGKRQPLSFFEKKLNDVYYLATCQWGDSSIQAEIIVIDRSDLF